jgi:Flp pilus assembly protein TadG
MRVTGRSGGARDRKRWRNRPGAAAVELGLVMPILILILFWIIEFARAWNVRQTLTDAAREGARIAVVNNAFLTSTQIRDSVENVVRRTASNAGLDLTQLTIATTNMGGGEAAQVQLQYVYNPLLGLVLNTPITMQTASIMRNE